MTDFTTILNRGIRRHIDKNIKSRKFGKCEGCERFALLIGYQDAEYEDEGELQLCEFCYTDILNGETD